LVSDLSDTIADGCSQEADQDLVDDERSEQFRIFGLSYQIEPEEVLKLTNR